jgi:hypothetical protein
MVRHQVERTQVLEQPKRMYRWELLPTYNDVAINVYTQKSKCFSSLAPR